MQSIWKRSGVRCKIASISRSSKLLWCVCGHKYHDANRRNASRCHNSILLLPTRGSIHCSPAWDVFYFDNSAMATCPTPFQCVLKLKIVAIKKINRNLLTHFFFQLFHTYSLRHKQHKNLLFSFLSLSLGGFF